MNGRTVSLIPRQLLFGNPDKAALQISADGKHISHLAPEEGVLNVWIAPRQDPGRAKAVTRDRGRGIQNYFWSYDNQHILYLKDEGGDENWQVHAVNIETGDDRNLTPIEEVVGPDGKPILEPNGKKLRPAAQIQQVSPNYPLEILIGLNDRDPQFHDIYRVNILTGDRELLQENSSFIGFLTDDSYSVRFAFRLTVEGGNEVLHPDGTGGWKEFLSIPAEDMLTTNTIALNKEGTHLYMLDSRGRDTAVLKTLDIQTGREELLAEDERADIQGILVHPTEKTIQAASSNYLKSEWQILDPSVESDFQYLKSLSNGELTITDRSHDDHFWTVALLEDAGPVRYYLYDRKRRRATFLFTNRRALEDLTLAPMHPEIIEARDGLQLVSYLTLPGPSEANRPTKPLPMVLLVHGGPWSRDTWGFDPMHQWLSNRGYAVLSVNYRGSTGFGKDFINASIREWGGKMHEDLLDAVDWAIAEGIAESKRVAIMGGSYGGYATLVALSFTPEVFACGVDIVGPSNLATLMETIPHYWKPLLDMMANRVGDPRTKEGQEFLAERSPLGRSGHIRKPLLIGQGSNDPRVKQSESDQIVKALQEKNIPVTYVLYPDEGHGFARPENRLSFYAITEMFLAEHMGGRFEAIGEAFRGSSVTIPAGAAQISGLEEELR